MASLAAIVQFHRSKKIRILAVTDSVRYEELPDIPAIAETFPGFEILGWSALFGPAHLPADITAQLNAAVAEGGQSCCRLRPANALFRSSVIYGKLYLSRLVALRVTFQALTPPSMG